MHVRILVINPNASLEMSSLIERQARAFARPDVDVDVLNPPGAPPAIESALDEAEAVPPMLALVHSAVSDGYHAIVIACFSDPGLDAARELTALPVVGIQEASMHLAAQLGYRYSVLITLAHRARERERAALLAGLERRLASCRPLGVSVLETVADRDRVFQKLVAAGRRAIDDDGADVLILGCAGLGDLAPELSEELRVPVIDPNLAAIKTAELLVDLGLTRRQRPADRAGSQPGTRLSGSCKRSASMPDSS
jgi:allantoin racemase